MTSGIQNLFSKKILIFLQTNYQQLLTYDSSFKYFGHLNYINEFKFKVWLSLIYSVLKGIVHQFWALGHFIDGHFIDGHFIDRTFHRQDIS